MRQDGEGKPWIRATQGHSISHVEDSVHRPLRSSDDLGQEEVVHGTFLQNWLKIRSEGLKTMGRNHIHLCLGLPNSGVISGMRKDCDVAVYVNIEKAMRSGIKFLQSSNGVILTSGDETNCLPVEFFSRAVYLGSEQVCIFNESVGDETEKRREESAELQRALEWAEIALKNKPAPKARPMPKKMPESLRLGREKR